MQNVEDLCRAITQHRIVAFGYSGGLRRVEPFTVWTSHAGSTTPLGWQVIVGRTNVTTQQEDAASAPERFIVVTNWFEELRQRMGN